LCLAKQQNTFKTCHRSGAEGQRRSRLCRSEALNTFGSASGAPVFLSKNGDGRASPSIHQRNILYVRRPKTLSDGGGGAFGGRRPMAACS